LIVKYLAKKYLFTYPFDTKDAKVSFGTDVGGLDRFLKNER